MTDVEKMIEAQRIINSDVFNEAFDELYQKWHKMWEDSTANDTKTREMAYNRVKAIQDVKREFVKLLNAKRMLEE